MMHTQFYLKEITYGSATYTAALKLRNTVLRLPLGLSIYDEDLRNEKYYFHLGLFIKDRLIAALVLIPLNSTQLQMRQVAVLPSYQGHHFGTSLIQFAETFALKHRYEHIFLNARQTALSFYKRQGYIIIGNPFLDLSILHQKMEKKLIKD